MVFAAVDRIDEARRWPADERYALALAPLAAPLPDVPQGFSDYVVEVRQFGDRFVPTEPIDPDDDALVGSGLPGGPLSHRALVTAATKRARELGLSQGDRLLVVDSSESPARPLDWLLVPLAIGGSVVLCRNTDPEKVRERATQERVTASVGA